MDLSQHFPLDPCLRMLYIPQAGIPMEYYDGRHAMLLREFQYISQQGVVITADSGFIFDGGTIPRVCWDTIGGPFEFYLPSYIIHDWLCDRAKESDQYDSDRLFADNTFLEMLLVLGCPKVKARLMYRAVRTAA